MNNNAALEEIKKTFADKEVNVEITYIDNTDDCHTAHIETYTPSSPDEIVEAEITIHFKEDDEEMEECSIALEDILNGDKKEDDVTTAYQACVFDTMMVFYLTQWGKVKSIFK